MSDTPNRTDDLLDEGARTFTSRDAMEYVASQTDTVFVSYSAGKDSLAVWLHCRYYFPNIIPVYHYTVPGLEFVDRYLDYVEKRLNAPIIRIPHPGLYRRLKHGNLQPPIEAALLQEYAWPPHGYDDLLNVFREAYDIQNAWVAVGTTQFDSANRRLTFKNHGMTRPLNKKFFPIGDWTKTDIMAVIRASGVKLPPDYHVWGRSFDGLDYHYLEGMRRHFPRDYERVLKWYPMAHLEFKRVEMRGRYPDA